MRGMDPEDGTDRIVIVCCGFHEWGLPLVSMRSESFGPSQGLPWRPLWPGFAINTIFYATLLWLLIPGLFALRRFLRVRRGLCPNCAYPTGESSVCTECGAVRQSVRDSGSPALMT